MRVAVFWNVAPCSLAETDRRFRGDYFLIDLMMEALRTCETSVDFYETTRSNIPQDRLLQEENTVFLFFTLQ
jgi:hypothetical protein